jgi:hypothetical protein
MKVNGCGGALLVDANGCEQRNKRRVPAGPTFASDRWRQKRRNVGWRHRPFAEVGAYFGGGREGVPAVVAGW